MTELSLSKKLLGEAAQTERSAARHCRIEAERLPDTGPGRAMHAVCTHAEREEPKVHRLAEERGVAASKIGAAIGNAFSVGRDQVTDLLLTCEQSYRGTLLGMRHGRDLVDLMRLAAATEHDAALEAWATAWLAAREPLLAAAAAELRWFAENQAEAMKNAKL